MTSVAPALAAESVEPERPRYLIQSLARGLALLDQVRASTTPLALAELSQMEGLSLVTTFRLMHTLEHAGYFVITAKDGMVAQALSRDYPGKIHVLVTDINMPNMGGLELSERISADRPDIQILVMSGDHFAENITSKFSFLHKPFAPQELCEAIKRLSRIRDRVLP